MYVANKRDASNLDLAINLNAKTADAYYFRHFIFV